VLVLRPDHIDDVDEHARARPRRRPDHPGRGPPAQLRARGSGAGPAAGRRLRRRRPDLRSPWEADACAEKLLQQFSAPYAFAESAFALRASVGLTVAPLHGTDPEQLMRHAEVARDLALRSRSGLEVYSEDRNAFTDRRLAVLRGLGPALRRREMRVHFQPQVDIASGALTGYEALLRWDHPVLGPVPPDEFVALAEHAGMMSEITEFVLDESLRQLADWRRQGRRDGVR
jgi:predicted signal transduction protein with EAL and GGDEF domain